MSKLIEIFQRKANKTAELISKAISVSEDLEPKNVSVSVNAIPCKVQKDGSFMVLTGTRDIPYGIGLTDPPELVLLYNEKGGIFIETSLVIDVIKSMRESIKPVIDPTYSIMGVVLNIGIISSLVGEDFLTALHQSSLPD